MLDYCKVQQKTMLIAMTMASMTGSVFAGGIDNTIDPAAAAKGAEAFGNGNTISATATSALFAGYKNVVDGDNAFAIGDKNKTLGTNSIAGGSLSEAHGRDSLAFGSSAQALTDYTYAIGAQARTNGEHTIAIGNGSYASGKSAVAIGKSSKATDVMATAVGYGTKASNQYSSAIGYQSVASGVQSTAVGSDVETTGDYSLATGNHAVASGDYSAAVGYKSKSTEEYAFAAGNEAVASGNSALAVGSLAKASGKDAIANGHSATADGEASIAIGRNASASGNSAVAQGNDTLADIPNSVAIGSNSVTDAAVGTSTIQDNASDIKFSNVTFAGSTPDSVVSFGANGRAGTSGITTYTRQLQNVSAGRVSSTSTDAVNGSQLYDVALEAQKYNTIVAGDNITVTSQDNAHGRKEYTIGLSPDIVNRINSFSSNTNSLHNIINANQKEARKGIAGSAALAGLHPLDFDPDHKLDIMAGYGHYHNANAAAIGVAYRPNEDIMITVGSTANGGDDTVYNAGISYKWGAKSEVSRSKIAMARDLADAKREIAKLQADNEQFKAILNSVLGLNIQTDQNKDLKHN